MRYTCAQQRWAVGADALPWGPAPRGQDLTHLGQGGQARMLDAGQGCFMAPEGPFSWGCVHQSTLLAAPRPVAVPESLCAQAPVLFSAVVLRVSCVLDGPCTDQPRAKAVSSPLLFPAPELPREESVLPRDYISLPARAGTCIPI